MLTTLTTLTIGSNTYSPLPGESWGDIVKRIGFTGALCVSVGGRPVSLNDKAMGEARVLTYNDEEGRRVYERSLRFVMLMAFARVAPHARVRIENTIGNGVLSTLSGEKVSEALISRVEAEMRKIVSEALPFKLSVVSKQEAIDIFASMGRKDTADLLKERQSDTFHIYECGGMKDYFYGMMAPDTSYVAVFALTALSNAFVLRLPEFDNPNNVSPLKRLPRLLETFTESNSWAKILEVSNARDLNRLTESGELNEFIRVNEALMDMKINLIAEQIISKGSRLVTVAGPSSSGKTTFTNRLAIALRVHGVKPVKLSLDDYYLDRDKAPLDENGEPDLECVDALDTPLINEQLKQILAGEEVLMPTFDFKTGKRSPLTHRVKVDTASPVLIEGIHGLNERLTSSIPSKDKFKIYISALTNLNLDDHNRIHTTDARLVRRLVRDAAFRGTPVEKTLSMWASVRRGEEKYIFPFQENADAMINSCLVYELAIMKKYIYTQLKAIPFDSPNYALARRLVKFLNYIKSSDAEDEVPLNSLLREFIGGSCFYKDV